MQTPALLIDLNTADANLKKMAAFFQEGPTRLRAHYKNHKCPALAKRQVAAGAIGMACATIDEAEALVRHGIPNVLLANEIAGTAKVERFARLSQEATDLIVALDNEETLAALASASAKLKVPVSVVVDVNIGQGRCGASPGPQALALAQLARVRGLRFRGLMGYEGHCGRLKPGPEKITATRQANEILVSTAKLIREHGLPVEIVTAGGTGTYSISGKCEGITEIQAGSYLLMDTEYRTVCEDFDLALSVLGTVISKTPGHHFVLDVGLKSISAERGLPVLKGVTGVRLRKLNAEHAIVDILDPEFSIGIGDQLELWAHYNDGTVNLHRQMFGMRNGRVEEILQLEG